MTNIAPWQQYQALYVHIPFCVQKCLYCDFTSYANCTKELIQKYVDALCEEIEHVEKVSFNAKGTVYFGGGTPSLLNEDQLTQIVGVLKKNGFWQKPSEATIEANPGTVDLAKLIHFRELGFDRISLGVQSLQDAELKSIGRIHNAEQALEAIAMANEAGFKRINADVIYGLPKQSLESLQSTIRRLVSQKLDHISVYGLILEEGTPLASLVEQGKVILPDEDCCVDMYEFVQNYLETQGFIRYEISNYAKKSGDSINLSRHNDVYWKYWPYLAFGAGAVSFDGKRRVTRPVNVREYIEWTKASSLESAFEEILTPAELLSEFLIMGLRRKEGVNLLEAKQRFGVDILQLYSKPIKRFMEHKLLVVSDDFQSMFLSPKGMALGNYVFEGFV